MNTTSTQNPLSTELATYHKLKATFLAEQHGRFVLIHGQAVAGFYDTWADALNIGYDKFGLEPFLVKQVLRIEPVHWMPF